MILKKFLSLILLSTFFSTVVVAQAPVNRSKEDTKQAEEESLEQKAYGLLNEAVKEAQLLRLPENRVGIMAKAAALLIKRDPKLARSLLAQVAADINELFNSPVDGVPGYSPKRSIAFQLRQEVMQILASKDAKTARDFMAATRPSSYHGRSRREDYLATPEVETAFELELAAQIAATDPKQALQIAEASLSKGLSEGLHHILARLQAKDPESADRLLDAILKKLQSGSVADDNASLGFAVTMVRFMTRAEEHQADSARDASSGRRPLLAGDEKSLKLLTGMIADAALSIASDGKSAETGGGIEFERMMMLQPVMGEIEKYAPDRAPALHKKLNELTSPLETGPKFYIEFQSSLESDDPEMILKLLDKAPEQMREGLQMEVAAKLIRMGEYDRARELLNHTGGDPTYRKNMFKMIDASLLEKAAVEGQIDLARQKLSALDSDEERAQVLIKLATGAAGKREKKIALQLLEEAGSLLSAQAENHIQLSARLHLALAYASLEPGKSFEIAELAIDRLNMLVAAAEVLSGFQPIEYFRNGEMQPGGTTMITSLIDQTIGILSALARVDFVRARAGADKFQRPETRARALLGLATAILSDQPQASGSTSNAVRFYTPRRH